MRLVGERTMVKKVKVKAVASAVFDAWTTPGGIRTFFAPEAVVELEPGGKYEVLFDMESAEGKRGSEGCKVLSYIRPRLFSFTWNSPPQFETSREKRTQWVVLEFEEAGGETEVTLTGLGWVDSVEGREVYDYFDRAWRTVLARLARSFESGPIDWSNPWRPAPPGQ